MATQTKHKTEANETIPLSITFSGPMLFDFDASSDFTTVDIYVPFCPYHEAGFFFSTGSISETDFWHCANSSGTAPLSERAYTITSDGIANPGMKPELITSSFPVGLTPKTITPPESRSLSRRKKTSRSSPGFILELPALKSVKTMRSRANKGGFLDKRMFLLTVPMPDLVYPLYYDSVEVVDDFGHKPTGNLLLHCSSLRFFYCQWDGKSNIRLNSRQNKPADITPPVFDSVFSQPNIDIRYEGFGVADENDPHSDARSCFASLATMAGTNWWLNFEDGMSTPTNPSQGSTTISPSDPCAPFAARGSVSILLHTGGDCHSPVIVSGIDT